MPIFFITAHIKGDNTVFIGTLEINRRVATATATATAAATASHLARVTSSPRPH